MARKLFSDIFLNDNVILDQKNSKFQGIYG